MTEATPVLELSAGAAVCVNFGQAPFVHPLDRFDGIMKSQSLI